MGKVEYDVYDKSGKKVGTASRVDDSPSDVWCDNQAAILQSYIDELKQGNNYTSRTDCERMWIENNLIPEKKQEYWDKKNELESKASYWKSEYEKHREKSTNSDGLWGFLRIGVAIFGILRMIGRWNWHENSLLGWILIISLIFIAIPFPFLQKLNPFPGERKHSKLGKECFEKSCEYGNQADILYKEYEKYTTLQD